MADQLAGSGSYADRVQHSTPDQANASPNGVLKLKSGDVLKRRSPDSWKPVDLRQYIDGTYKPPTPSVGLHRTDGLHFLYPGKHHEILGETESGKTWFCLMCVIAEIRKGHNVVYIHFEESDAGSTVERLVDLGATEEELLAQFYFIGPVEKGNPQSVQGLVDVGPSLVVLDGVNEAMGMHGWDINSPAGYTKYREAVVRPFTTEGAATLEADHVTKSRDGRGNNAFGTVHKGNSIDGARMSLENKVPFGRNRVGKSKVYVTKDRPGYLRMHGSTGRGNSSKFYMGDLEVDDTQNTLEATLTEGPAQSQSDSGNANFVEDAARILDVLRAAPDCQLDSGTKVNTAIKEKYGLGLRKETLSDTLRKLVSSKKIQEYRGRGTAIGYRITHHAKRGGSAVPTPAL